MIELAFLVCMAGDPDNCREEKLVFVDVPVRTCVLQAQTELARWSATNADWLVQRWTCRPVDVSTAEL